MIMFGIPSSAAHSYPLHSMVDTGRKGRKPRTNVTSPNFNAAIKMKKEGRGEMRIMYDKILVAVDQSPVSDRAVLAARDLALLSKGEVWVLHLRESEWGGKAGALPPRETPSEADAEVAASVEVLTQAGVKAHGMVKNTMYGHAAREIVADAIELDCGVIVMGSRGRGDLAGLVVGSTAHKVIHLADRPVLIVPPAR